jgi:hypothetical protein
MKTLIFILSVCLLACSSPSVEPTEVKCEWSALKDSIGQPLYTAEGNYIVVTEDSISEQMKAEVAAYVNEMNSTEKFKSGVEIDGINQVVVMDTNGVFSVKK